MSRASALAGVLGGVADDTAGVRDAPEGVGVGADSVEDLEGDAVLVADILASILLT